MILSILLAVHSNLRAGDEGEKTVELLQDPIAEIALGQGDEDIEALMEIK